MNSHKLHCSHLVFSFWLIAVIYSAWETTFLTFSAIGDHTWSLFLNMTSAVMRNHGVQLSTTVHFLKIRLVLFPGTYYCLCGSYVDGYNVWISTSLLFGRWFVLIALLTAWYKERMLTRKTLRPCLSYSTTPRVITRILGALYPCGWRDELDFFDIHLWHSFWLSLFCAVGCSPAFQTVCMWFQVTVKCLTKNANISAEMESLCFQKGKFPSQPSFQNERWKVSYFSWLWKLAVALQGQNKNQTAHQRVLIVYCWVHDTADVSKN